MWALFLKEKGTIVMPGMDGYGTMSGQKKWERMQGVRACVEDGTTLSMN